MKSCPQCQREYADHVKFCPRDGSALQAVATQTDPLVGRVIAGSYEVLQFLGGGGFGNVYKVRNLRLDDIEALKIIHPEHLREREPLERFRREARLLRKLGSKSTHIVDLYSLEEDKHDRIFYFTMEYVEGAPLTNTLVQEGPMAVPRALKLMRQVCSALKVAHAQGIIHRDMKLDNVLLAREGQEERVKILDFGIAKVMGQKSLSDLSKGMPGTVGYAAPEQVKGEADKINAATDLFATGVILYNLVTAREPWNGNPIGKPSSEGSDWEVIRKTLEENPLPARKFNPGLPKELEGTINKLLEKDPKRRFQSATELDAALARVQTSLEPAEVGGAKGIAGFEAAAGVAGSAAAAVRRAAATVFVLVRKKALPAAAAVALVVIGFAVKKFVLDRPGPMPVAAIEVRPTELELDVDKTGQLLATPKDSLGEMLLGRRVTWSSRNPDIATVDQEGRVRAVAPGRAVIIASSGARRDSARVNVVPGGPGPLARVLVEPDRTEVMVGRSTQLRATLEDAEGNPVDDEVGWSSDNERVARVDPSTGRVEAVSPGEATITAKSGGQTGTATIVVTERPPPPVASVQITPNRAAVEIGATSQLTATLRDDQGTTLNRETRWSSSNPSVASVTQTGRVGRVTGRAPGNTTITAVSEGVSGQAIINVSQAGIASLQLDQGDVSLEAGQSTELRATARDASGRPVSDRRIDWSSEDEGVARVDRVDVDPFRARVSGVKPGTTTVRAASEGKTDEAMVSVSPKLEEAAMRFSAAEVRFSDNSVTMEASLTLQGLQGSKSCAIAFFLDESGSALQRDGKPVTVSREFTPQSSDHRLLVSLPVQQLPIGRREIRRHRFQVEVGVFQGPCNSVSPDQKPLAISRRMPFCVRKLAIGYDNC